MNFFLLGVMVELMLIAPISVSADLWYGHQTEATVTLRVWGVRFLFRLRLTRDKDGHHLVLLPRHETEKPREAPVEQVRQGVVLLGTALRADHARRYFLRRIRLIRLDALLRLGLRDAAGTALWTGLLAGLTGMFPLAWRSKTDIRIQPDFMHDRTSLNARCIVFFRLGNLLFAALMVLAAWAMEQREHRAAQREKEA